MTSSFSRHAVRELAELHRAPLGQEREHRVDRVAHARADRRDVRRSELPRRPWARGPCGAAARSAFERDAFERVGRERAERFLRPGRARHRTARGLQPLAHDARRVLERLALEQAREQQVALLEAHQLFVEIDVLAAREEAPGLQLDERRRDQQELGRDVEIDPLHVLDLGAEHVDDAREGDLPEVDLFLEDQVQKEVERAFENRCRDLVRHPVRLPAENHRHVVQRTHLRKRPGVVVGGR